jgi:hypothetical protein
MNKKLGERRGRSRDFGRENLALTGYRSRLLLCPARTLVTMPSEPSQLSSVPYNIDIYY